MVKTLPHMKSALQLYQSRAEALKAAAPNYDIVLCDDYGAFTTLLDMAESAGQAVGDLGLLRDMAAEGSWDELWHLTIQYANVRAAVSRLRELGHSVALVMPEVKGKYTPCEKFVCIATFEAAQLVTQVPAKTEKKQSTFEF